MKEKRKQMLDNLKKKQDFRVSVGKSKWHIYTSFNQNWDLRELLDDEICIEFDMPKDYGMTLQQFRDTISFPAVNDTAINLYNAGLGFEIWDHKGKSPHIHIRDLPISHLEPKERKIMKQVITRKYVPEKYNNYTDFSLCGIHLVSIEWSQHWKKKYSWKKLLFKHKASGILQ